MNGWLFWVRKKGIKLRDFLKIKGKKEVDKSPSGGPDPNAPRKNRYYVMGTE